jgi:hypothetical protein
MTGRPKKGRTVSSSFTNIIGVNLATLLVMISLAILTVRLRRDDSPKMIADSAQVSVVIPEPPVCFSARWNVRTGRGARLQKQFPENADVPRRLPHIGLVSNAGSGKADLLLTMTPLPGCDNRDAVISAGQVAVASFTEFANKRSPEFREVINAFEKAIQSWKQNDSMEFLNSVKVINKWLFVRDRYIFCHEIKEKTVTPCSNYAAAGYICYRFDDLAARLGLKRPDYEPMYQAFIDGPYFNPGVPQHIVIAMQLDTNNQRADLAARKVEIDIAKTKVEFRQFTDETTSLGSFLKTRGRYLDTLNEFYAGGSKSQSLLPEVFTDSEAKNDWICYLLGKEMLILLESQSRIKVEVRVKSTGDGSDGTREIVEFPVHKLIGNEVTVATIRFLEGKRSRIIWNDDLAHSSTTEALQ